MRDFEVMATGTMLLTNWIPTIEEVFSNGNDLVLYRDEEEMVEKARFYIEHENEREEIAKTGYEKVIKNHTIIHRVEKMLDAYCAKNCKVIGGVEGSTPSPSSPSNINDIGKEGENKICVKNEKGEIK
jgi:spore maturation protein CgeB